MASDSVKLCLNINYYNHIYIVIYQKIIINVINKMSLNSKVIVNLLKIWFIFHCQERRDSHPFYFILAFGTCAQMRYLTFFPPRITPLPCWKLPQHSFSSFRQSLGKVTSTPFGREEAHQWFRDLAKFILRATRLLYEIIHALGVI